MPYETLEQRFLANATDIYKQYNNLSALVPQIKPDTKESRSRIKDDSRSLPVESTRRDAKLFKSFLASGAGQLFIGKQLLLQTGNTFAETRFFNPISFAGNTVPFLHLVRFLGNPLYDFSKPTRDNRGALQQETVDGFSTKTDSIFSRVTNRITSAIKSPFNALVYAPKSTNYFGGISEFYVRPEDTNDWSPRLLVQQSLIDRGRPWVTKTHIPTPVTELGGYNNVSSGANLKIYTNRLTKISLFPTLPPLTSNTPLAGSYISAIEVGTGVGLKFKKGFLGRSKFVKLKPTVDPNRYRVHGNLGITELPSDDDLQIASVYDNKQTVSVPNNIAPIDFYRALAKFTQQKVDNSDNATTFTSLQNTRDGNGYFYGPKFGIGISSNNANGENISVINAGGNVRDSYNAHRSSSLSQIAPDPSIVTNIDAIRYDTISQPEAPKSDIIKFIFKSTAQGASPVHFRAFLSNIKESIKTEYNEQRYIGRTERFVTYAGAKRNVALEFNIVAFSEKELHNMWTRINYLTGLTFPRGASLSGFMIPPLINVTIGNIYEDQPCYIESLDYDFLDDKITFDINEEVSQVINVRMSLILLEKNTRFYNSPFYKIAETIAANQKTILATRAAEVAGPPPRLPFEVEEQLATSVATADELSRNPDREGTGDYTTRGLDNSPVRLTRRSTDGARAVQQGTTEVNNLLLAAAFRGQSALYPNAPISVEDFCIGQPPEKQANCQVVYRDVYLPLFRRP